jgi:hypothetical protein
MLSCSTYKRTCPSVTSYVVVETTLTNKVRKYSRLMRHRAEYLEDHKLWSQTDLLVPTLTSCVTFGTLSNFCVSAYLFIRRIKKYFSHTAQIILDGAFEMLSTMSDTYLINSSSPSFPA